MDSSIKLLTVRGIDIRMHITFPLILVWAAIQFGFLTGGGLAGALFGVVVVLILFVIVTLHELGHSIAAQNYGVPVQQIVLLPIGGVAQLSRIPENPIQEFVIAIAGPAVNFILAILLWIVAIVLNISITLSPAILIDIQRVTFPAVFTYVFISNLFLGIFNLLPAFPMDGGRVLRALLATRLEYTQATAIATTVGRAMAWLFGLYGFLTGNFFIILIAFFIYMGAGQEEALVKTRAILRGLTVRQAFSRQAHALRPENTLQDAVTLTLSSFQASFPVCDGSQLVGLLTYPRLVEVLGSYPPLTPVAEVMLRDVPTASVNEELFDVQRRMQEEHLDALPVVDNGRFLGLITSSDIGEVYRLLSVEPTLLSRKTIAVEPRRGN